jgi:hypothetical protein
VSGPDATLTQTCACPEPFRLGVPKGYCAGYTNTTLLDEYQDNLL